MFGFYLAVHFAGLEIFAGFCRLSKSSHAEWPRR